MSIYCDSYDKDGFWIYENDICTFSSEEDKFFVVQYDNSRARFVLKNNEQIIGFDTRCTEKIKVVGNIFDIEYYPLWQKR